ncbi:hypothetical protein NQ314_003293 [Rhamnusium bicolor]|uniref:Uncharacterized protein n=1 Tax=Rhamnusium bicolor TaxID=1586634 RepID=A0AAV8ZMH7_9CUCU|nr:hypothetical protein NQ314_003293 [Rhamnusium bicolor]
MHISIALLENSSTISSSESSSSSSDSCPIVKKRLRVRRILSRITGYAEDTVEKYSDEEFKTHFRMSRQTAHKIIGKVCNF